MAGARPGYTIVGVQKAFVEGVNDEGIHEVEDWMQGSPEMKLETGIKKKNDQRHFQSPLGSVRHFS